MLVIPGIGSLAAAMASNRGGGGVPLYVGAGLASLAAAGMFVVVTRISDTNTWELASVSGRRENHQGRRTSAPSTEQEIEDSLQNT
ncbi:hypothetical protein GGI21_005190, partial [Coemansia aciculifera]